MHVEDGAALVVGVRPSARVVEDEDAVGPGDVIQQQLLHLGVVLSPDELVVGEGCFCGWSHVLGRLECVVVQTKVRLPAPDVLDQQRVWVGLDVPLRLAGG